ncbi:hypothetical protein [Deinococcus apachensis]|uniref:hypothetical protein n=1 Tax=Deinococcus apachensis TaxID=309886 RepID=UPI0012FADD22|nr:hypothetical protein [Deinococcus apachensis]
MVDWDALKQIGYNVNDDNNKVASLDKFLEEPSFDKLVFAVSVIADDSESDYVRFEACRSIRDIDTPEWERTNLCSAINKILSDPNEDVTLQQWAAYLTNKCLNNYDLTKTIIDCIANQEDFRWNIIDSLREAEYLGENVRLLLKLVLHGEVQDDVKEAINELLN